MVKFVRTQADFDAEVKAAGDHLVVVDFTASWCPPCKRLSPVVDELSKEYDGKVVFVKCDVEDGDLGGAMGITAMPTLKFFKGGSQVAEIVGLDINGLKAKVEQLK